ncbi:phosphatase 2C-like domain-containing protein [Tuber indicum]|nr:phosphatase 2C-like domain-containing protein [Tuber indicum]
MCVTSTSFSILSRTRLLATPLPPRSISKRCFLTLASSPSNSTRDIPNPNTSSIAPPPSTTLSPKPSPANPHNNPRLRPQVIPPKPPKAAAATVAATRPLIKPIQYGFKTNFSLFAKRAPRPFPPPFNSPPASSFSDALSTHHPSRIPTPEGATFLRGITNGDDAILHRHNQLGVADGVGAWNTKIAGHAALWSRLILHYWSLALDAQRKSLGVAGEGKIDIVSALQRSYSDTVSATTREGKTVWQGTTTACVSSLEGSTLTVANIGDSRAYVYRPSSASFVYKSTEQWHWFDCPYQLGTNSLDTPAANAVVDKVDLEEGDIVILTTDGLPDNLWDVEIADICAAHGAEGVGGLADKLVNAAWKTAINPFGESPYMERGIDEGLSMEGGKYDDISVVTAVFKRRQ